MNEKIFDQYILNTGLVDRKQLNIAKKHDQDLFVEESLERLGVVTQDKLYFEISQLLGIPLIDLTVTIPSVFAVRLILPRVLRQYQVIPLACDDETIEIATFCPGDFNVIDSIRFACERHVIEHLARRRQILEALNDILGHGGEDEANMEVMSAEEAERREKAKEEDHRLKSTDFLTFDEVDAEKEAATIINQLLKNAIFRKASDIHFEPRTDCLHIRDRIDGELQLASKLHHAAGKTIASRLKVLAKMNIAVKNKPQDGNFSVTSKGKRTDLRVSTVPTPYGEKVVIRFLDPERGNVQLKDIGMLEDVTADVRKLIANPQGLVIVTGPTGSGKSSTLCSIINAVKSEDINIVSVEDPIEYKIKGVNQIGVNVKQGMTFASALKAILRQDPDIIYVGEIRDAETAITALQAAQTGHLVFSTLHTNDAVTAITRLINMGVPADMIADSLTAVLAQRLTRRICNECAESVEPTKEEFLELEPLNFSEPINMRRSPGCMKCYDRGYSGRIAINELLVIDKNLRDLISKHATSTELFNQAAKNGMRTMWQTGIVLAAKGITTIEEIGRHVPKPLSSAEYKEEQAEKNEPISTIISNDESVPELTPKNNEGVPGEIFIVDDDPSVLDLLEKGLEIFDANITRATDGQKALEIINTKPPDLIITDIHMPNCNGFELCHTLLKDEKTKNIPIVILTGDPSVEAEIQSFEIGAIDFIRKPVRIPALIARVKAVYARAKG